LADRVLEQRVVASPINAEKSLWGQEAEMKKLMMVVVIGLGLATMGFAQGRGRFGGGHFSGGSGGHSFSGRGYGGGGFSARSHGSGGFRYSGRGFAGRFSGQSARGGRYEAGFSGYRSGYGYGGSSLGFGFAYVPAPYWSGYAYSCPDPCCYNPNVCGPACLAPTYYPPAYSSAPVVGVGIIGKGLELGRAIIGHSGGWQRFAMR
jgi:hypothetical protein